MVGRKEQEEGIQFRQRRWKERKGSEERMGGCKTRERRLWQCYLAMRLICMRSWPSQTSLRSHCIALRGITMVLYPMEKARKRSNQKPEASYPPSSFSTSPPPVILRPFLLSLSGRWQHMLNNLRGTSGLELYRELYHTCAYILVYVDTSLLRGSTQGRLLAGTNWPIPAIRVRAHPDLYRGKSILCA